MKNVLILFFISFLFACNSNNTKSTPSPPDGTEKTTPTRPPYTNLSHSAFRKFMGQTNTIVLDVRTPEETAKGTIERAIEIDFQSSNFKEQVAALDKEKTYLVYCHSGGRSSSACELMGKMGFKNLYNLRGGYSGWPTK